MTGKTVTLESGARLQERSLALDDRQAMRAIFKREKELEEILDSEDATEPEKAEALRELETIAEFQRKTARRSIGNAQRSVRAVRKAIGRLYNRLLTSFDATGKAHPILRPFAGLLQKTILSPSARYAGSIRARGNLAGSFTSEPQHGINWAD